MGNNFTLDQDEKNEAYLAVAKFTGVAMAGAPPESWGTVAAAGNEIRDLIKSFAAPFDPAVNDAIRGLEKLKMGFSADERLEYDFNQYHDFLMHTSWELLPDEFRKDIKEPPRGCGKCKDAHDEWLKLSMNNGVNRVKMPVVGDLFNAYADSTWRRKVASISGWERDDKIG